MTDWEKRYERLDHDVRELTTALAHDLRAPIRAVDGFSRALANECAGRLEETPERYLGLLRESALRAALLLEGLVSLARLSTTPVRRQAVDMAALAGRLVAELRAADPDRQVDVLIDPNLRVEADGHLLPMLLESLLSNAWKFTRTVQPAKIQLGKRDEGSRTVFYVSDSGVGFDMDRSERLFQPFCRLHASADHPGLGLGLARARRVVSCHGGEIWAASASGAGATFSFTL